MKTTHDGQRWTYKGFIIWFFDGYYDVHDDPDAHPLAEGLNTQEEARAFIDNERWFQSFSQGKISISYNR